MKILIIRHAEPDYKNNTLTQKGFREAELLSKRLKKTNIDYIYCSPLERAKLTARPTLDKLNVGMEVLPWLEEFTGRVVTDDGKESIPWNLKPQYWTEQKLLYQKNTWLEQELMATGTVKYVYDNAVNSFDCLLEGYGYIRDGQIYKCFENKDITIAIFCHFGMGCVLLSHLLGVAPPVMWHSFFLPTSSVSTLVTEERVKGEVFLRCLQIGDTSHLYAADEPISRAGLFSELYS